MIRACKTIAVVAALAAVLAGCDDAEVASRNISKAADNFEIQRRVVFVNGITGEHMLLIEGRCAIVDQKTQLEVTCKQGPEEYVKHFLGLADNVTYVAEQVGTVDVNVYHYRRTFKPQAVIPDIDFRGDAGALVDSVTPDSKD